MARTKVSTHLIFDIGPFIVDNVADDAPDSKLPASPLVVSTSIQTTSLVARLNGLFFLGKAPRKQLAAKSQARKTAAVRVLFFVVFTSSLVWFSRPQLVVSRSLIVSGLVPSLFVRFVGTRSRRSSSSASSPSNVLFVRSLRTSRYAPFVVLAVYHSLTYLLAD